MALIDNQQEMELFMDELAEKMLEKLQEAGSNHPCHFKEEERKFVHYLIQGAGGNPDAAHSLGRLALTYKKSCEKIGQSIVILFLTGMLVLFAMTALGKGPLGKIFNEMGGK